MLRRSRHIHYGVALVCAFAAYASLGARAPPSSQDQQRALQILDALTKPFSLR